MSESNVKEVRLDNFRLLYEVLVRTTQRDFGSVLGIQQSEVSNHNTGAKPIDFALAHQIEATFNLPRGWMDRPNAGLRLTAQEFELLELVRGRDQSFTEALVGFLKATGTT